MKALRTIAIALIVIVAVVAVGGYFLPSGITVSRFTTINAPNTEVFTVVNSLRTFSRWSPWTQRDPGIVFAFEGPDFGVGQKLKWQSHNDNIGKGSMEITDSLSDEKVVMKIAYGGMSHATTSLALDEVDGGATKVTWSFAYSVGGNPFARYVALVMPTVVGSEYARGLASLKQYVEAIPKVDISDLQVTRVSVAPQTVISFRETADNTPDGMNRALTHSYKTLSQTIQSAGLTGDGQPISVAEATTGPKVTIQTSFPVKDVPENAKLPDGVLAGKSGDGEALRVEHKGDVASLKATYLKLLAYAMINGWKVRGSSWNEYVSDPTKTRDPQIDANIYLPIE